jgi:predicted CoA-substrate-specific enzyme activase
VGASATKVVLIDADGTVVARVVAPSGVSYGSTARTCLHQALEAAGCATSDLPACTVATGYGRRNVDFANSTRTEIHCHGVGCYQAVPRAVTVVDIGGQDNKVIRLDAEGRRLDFKMNRKCAAGTGAFIEEMALRLGVPLQEMEELAGEAAAEGAAQVRLSSFCTVFAKTEILAHLRQGVPVSHIVLAAFDAVVARVLEMAPLPGEVAATGGVVAHNPTIGALLSARLGRDVLLPPHPQHTGALGAALVALRDCSKEGTTC